MFVIFTLSYGFLDNHKVFLEFICFTGFFIVKTHFSHEVIIFPPDGSALMIFTHAQQETLNDAVSATLQQLQLNLLESKETTVNGMLAISALSNQISQDQSTGQQQIIKVLSYFIDYNDTFYVFHGISAETDFNIL